MKIIETPNWENSKVRQMEKDFNFEKYISERLLEIDDEKTRVEMRELMQHTMIPFYRHTEEAYRGFVERYRISAEASMGSCDVITGLMKRGQIDVTDHSFAQDAQSCVVYGMPKAIAEAGVVDEVVSLNQVAKTITKNVGEK